MRRPARYSSTRFKDPKDKRFVSIVRNATGPEERGVNILGVPYDGAVLGRKGAAGGPSAIREALALASNYNPELGLDLLGARVNDLGDLVVRSDDVERVQREIGREVAGVLTGSSLLVVLGGDNSVSLPSIVACAKKFHRIGLIVLDSHFDLRGKINAKPTSGSSYGLAVKALKAELGPKRIVEIGSHGFVNSRTYAEEARRLGLTIFTAEDVRKLGPTKVAQQAFEIASKGSKAVYVSVDLDVVDIAYVNGVSAPSVGGLSPKELNAMLFYLGRRQRVVCSDIVELAPSLDPSGRSQIVASTALLHLIAGFTVR